MLKYRHHAAPYKSAVSCSSFSCPLIPKNIFTSMLSLLHVCLVFLEILITDLCFLIFSPFAPYYLTGSWNRAGVDTDDG